MRGSIFPAEAFDPSQWKQCVFGDAIATTDPNSRADVAFAAGTNGAITGTIKAGTADSYPLDAMAIWFAPVDAAGDALDPAKSWSVELALVMDTQPGTSSDTAVEVGLLNEAAPSATIDGVYAGIHATAGGRRVRGSAVNNGVNLGPTEDGASAGSLTGVQTLIHRIGTRRNTTFFAFGMDNLGESIMADIATNAAGSNYFQTGAVPTIFASIRRTATTAGTVAVAFRVYYRVLGQTELLQ